MRGRVVSSAVDADPVTTPLQIRKGTCMDAIIDRGDNFIANLTPHTDRKKEPVGKQATATTLQTRSPAFLRRGAVFSEQGGSPVQLG